jgi:hypothetical protein
MAARKAPRSTIKTIEAARSRGGPRLKAVAAAQGVPGPQQANYRPRGRR